MENLNNNKVAKSTQPAPKISRSRSSANVRKAKEKDVKPYERPFNRARGLVDKPDQEMKPMSSVEVKIEALKKNARNYGFCDNYLKQAQVLLKDSRGHDKAVKMLYAFIKSSEVDPGLQFKAARMLSNLSGHKDNAAEYFRRVAENEGIPEDWRVKGALELADIKGYGNEAAKANCLSVLAVDSKVTSYNRMAVVRKLSEMTGQVDKKFNTLYRIVSNIVIPSQDKDEATKMLVENRGRFVAYYQRIGLDERQEFLSRKNVARVFAEVGEYSAAASIYFSIVTQKTFADADHSLYYKLSATRGLALLKGQEGRAVNAYLSIVEDSSFSIVEREKILEEMFSLEGQTDEAARALLAFARGKDDIYSQSGLYTFQAAKKLCKLEGQIERSIEALRFVVQSNAVPDDIFDEASELLFQLDQQMPKSDDDLSVDINELLGKFTKDNKAVFKYLVDAADCIAREGKQSQKANVLFALSQEQSLDGATRLVIANQLAKLRGQSEKAAEACFAIAQDKTVKGYIRLDSATALSFMDGEKDRAAEAFSSIVRDKDVSGGVRALAVSAVKAMDGKIAHAKEACIAVAANIEMSTFDRMHAARELMVMGGGDEAAQAYLSIVKDTKVGVVVRELAAQALRDMKGQTNRAAEAYFLIAKDKQLDDFHRFSAVKALTNIDDQVDKTIEAYLAVLNDVRPISFITNALAALLDGAKVGHAKKLAEFLFNTIQAQAGPLDRKVTETMLLFKMLPRTLGKGEITPEEFVQKAKQAVLALNLPNLDLVRAYETKESVTVKSPQDAYRVLARSPEILQLGFLFSCLREKSQIYSPADYELKHMAHRFSIPQLQTSAIKHDGFQIEATYPDLLASFVNYSQTDIGRNNLSEVDVNKVTEMLEKGVVQIFSQSDPFLSHLTLDIEGTEDVVLPVGIHNEGSDTGHSVCGVKYGELGFIVDFSALAEGVRNVVGIEVYQADQLIASGILDKVLTGKGLLSLDDQDAFDADGLRPIAELVKKAQTIGNCPRASAKGALLVAIMCGLNAKNPEKYPMGTAEEIQKVFERAKEIFSDWSLQDRIQALTRYPTTEGYSPDVLHASAKKLYPMAHRRLIANAGSKEPKVAERNKQRFDDLTIFYKEKLGYTDAQLNDLMKQPVYEDDNN